jgi:SPP1 gp7 family putative phage head morphogenesis protein
MDAAHDYTDAQLAKLVREYKRLYTQAIDELDEKLQAFEIEFADEDEEMRAKVEAGAMKEKQYRKWRATRVATSERWEYLQAELADELTRVNEIAQASLNSTLYSIYIENHRYSTWAIHEAIAGSTAFTMYDRYTVARLLKNETELLPEPSLRMKREIDAAKDRRWQMKTLRAHVLQGLLQGESIPDIAERLPRAACETNFHGQIRRARTMVTSAQNLGRMDAYHTARDMGIDTQKQWFATLDNRTRSEHRLMSGEVRPLDEPFSNGLMYPGDPDGDPAEVYNCRCTTIAVLRGQDLHKAVTDGLDQNAYKEWRKGLKVKW